MVDMNAVEDLVSHYLDCWKQHRPEYSGLWEDNDFGCEHWQIFRHGLEAQTFSHEEMSQLSVLLTRSLRGQINRDHKVFWAWCVFVGHMLHDDVALFRDGDWMQAFGSLVNLLLAGKRISAFGQAFLAIDEERRKYVNYHLLQVEANKHLVAGPLAFAALEGILRRKNHCYVAKDGRVLRSFRVEDPTGKPQTFPAGRRVNRINDGLRLFEQVITCDRGRACPALLDIGAEITALYPGKLNAYDLIDEWRNDLVHGREFWQNRTPILLNIVCLLAVDEIEPETYARRLPDVQRHMMWQQENVARFGPTVRAPWDVFPPDVTH